MTHANAPLSAEGRRRLIERCKTRPIAHVAAETGISRACASKWVNRWRKHGDIRLLDRSSTPHHQPSATSADIAQRIEATRRECKWPASRITFELNDTGVMVSHRTVTRLLAHLGLHGRRFIDPDGDTNRKPRTIVAKRPCHMVHVDVKKVGRIPDGGSRLAHYNYHRPHGAAGGKPPVAAVDRRCHQRHGLIQPASARTLATAVPQDPTDYTAARAIRCWLNSGSSRWTRARHRGGGRARTSYRPRRARPERLRCGAVSRTAQRPGRAGVSLSSPTWQSHRR